MKTVSINEKEMIKITESILGMAIKYSEYIHIFTAYYPHTHELTVYVYPANSNYSDILENKGGARLYDNNVYLGKERCVSNLRDMYLEITNLVEDILPEVINEGEGDEK